MDPVEAAVEAMAELARHHPQQFQQIVTYLEWAADRPAPAEQKERGCEFAYRFGGLEGVIRGMRSIATSYAPRATA